MCENPRRGRQARNFTINVPKILVLKLSSEQIFSRKWPLGAPVLKYIRDFFMGIKKSNFLKDRFELSSFILKIYNVNAGNRRYASVSSVRKGAKSH